MIQWRAYLTSSESCVLVVGLGATTPIGRTVWASAAAVRAGVSGFAQHAFMVDALGAPMRVAPFPWLDEGRDVVDRIGDGLVAAIREALAPLGMSTKRLPIALFVNLPSRRPALPSDLANRIGKRLHVDLAGVFERLSVEMLGHAGGFTALQSAQQIIAAAPQTLCLVAGADSYLDPDMLEWLESTDQMHGAGERNNAWGFVPGEGSGALMLSAPNTAKRLGLELFGRVTGVGLGQETELIGTGSVCLGLGLTEAVRGAFAGLSAGEQVTDVYCDMNGEPYRADEFAFLVTRVRERFVTASEFVAPADCWGDVGAASAPLLVALACVAGAKRYSKGKSTLVWGSSVNGERGAAMIETAGLR